MKGIGLTRRCMSCYARPANCQPPLIVSFDLCRTAPGWRGLAYLPHGTAQTTKIKNNRRNTFSFSVSTGSNRGVRCGEGGASSDRFTPAKGQNFPKASRYLFLIVSIQRISVTKFKCPEHRIYTQNIKTAFLFFFLES